jgi:cytidylate kinase
VNVSIAIDGPAGAGKSTVARAVAETLGYTWLDTGRMYRAVTWHMLKRGVDVNDPAAVAAAAEGLVIDADHGRITVNGEDAAPHVRTQEVTASVSAVSAVKAVRVLMVDLQRRLAQDRSIVMDGRDIASVVLPGATFKFYLDASIAERGRRRLKDLGLTADRQAEVEADIRRRDGLDSSRKESPLRKMADAIVLDTTDMSAGQVVTAIVDRVRNTIGHQSKGASS